MERAAATDNYESVRARFIAACVVDDDGHRLFTDDEWQFVATLDARYLVPIFEAIEGHLHTLELEEAAKN